MKGVVSPHAHPTMRKPTTYRHVAGGADASSVMSSNAFHTVIIGQKGCSKIECCDVVDCQFRCLSELAVELNHFSLSVVNGLAFSASWRPKLEPLIAVQDRRRRNKRSTQLQWLPRACRLHQRTWVPA
jgi:hypothetical protein